MQETAWADHHWPFVDLMEGRAERTEIESVPIPKRKWRSIVAVAVIGWKSLQLIPCNVLFDVDGFNADVYK